ncbi:hypothetical protein HPB51_021008 [Rhipicephalus microplus]|uniref:DDE Tnp4 domain-containing protein n=1 Tax=Rhipicephalus microplus TaxID=6941 RepID=A0A9J6DCX8_RHIMP|nr:hypothetical protein HPB51_021008 [Rhipicephalus microplus]
MKNGDESLFYTFYRMSPATFDVLHSLVKEELTRDQCPSREPISSGERLALTLRYLSLGMLVRDAAMAFRVGIETARNIIHETCAVLWEVLAPEYMKVVNVSAPERFSDGGILQDSPIGERLHEGELSLPRAAMLPRSGRVCRHVFVGDEAFQLRPDFMRPLPGSRSVPAEVIYNYRLSRARVRYNRKVFFLQALCGKRLRHSCLSLADLREANKLGAGECGGRCESNMHAAQLLVIKSVEVLKESSPPPIVLSLGIWPSG